MAESRTYSGNGSAVTIADPDNITRDECLQLALCGKDAWNLWRNDFQTRGGWGHPYKNTADFSNQDFSLDHFDFCEFNFGDGANFSEAHFHSVFFSGAQFGRDVSFSGTKFGDRSSFEGAKFGPYASFHNSQFGDDCSFEDCRIDSHSSFKYVKFGANLNFSASLIGDGADFSWSAFGIRTSFVGAILLGEAYFDACSFGLECDFSGLMVGNAISFEASVFKGQVSFKALSWVALRGNLGFVPRFEEHQKDAQKWLVDPWSFKRISYAGTRFEGSVDFSGRHFEDSTKFCKTLSEIVPHDWIVGDIPSDLHKEIVKTASGNEVLPDARSVVFSMPPEFFQCKLHQDTSFEDASFPLPTGSESAARAYRTLKLAFAQQQAVREEQRFFKLEMQEEAIGEKSWRRWLYRAYQMTSDFGFSISRPLGLFVLATLVATLIYANQAGLTFDFSGSHTAALVQFSIASAIPGLEKLAEPAAIRLFGDLAKGVANYNVWVVLTLLAHKAVSILALFLIGLALRNLFKMK